MALACIIQPLPHNGWMPVSRGSKKCTGRINPGDGILACCNLVARAYFIFAALARYHMAISSMVNSHPYLNNLTPLRGAAATWVAIYHFGTTVPLFQERQTTIIAKGYMMVDLFFIMSGFIMRYVYGVHFTRQVTKPDLQRFIVARFARIYPLHLFTLLVAIIMAASAGNWNPVNDPAAIPTNLLLLQSFGIHRLSTWNRPSWSLSAEWAAYMVFPLLSVFFYRQRRLAYWVLPPLIALVYIALVYWIPPAGIGNADRLILHKLDVTYDYGFLRGIAGFTLGMIGYGLYTQPRIYQIFDEDAIALVFISATLLCMHTGVNDLFLIIAFLGVTLCFASNSGYIHQVCNFRPAQFLGKISYSIYLMQWIVTPLFITLVKSSGIIPLFPPVSFFHRLVYVLTYMLLLIGLSSVTYSGIEKPCRNFINRKYAHFIKVKHPDAISN